MTHEELEAYKNGKSIDEILREREAKNMPTPLPITVEQYVELKQQGLKDVEIAEKLGLTKMQLANWKRLKKEKLRNALGDFGQDSQESVGSDKRKAEPISEGEKIDSGAKTEEFEALKKENEQLKKEIEELKSKNEELEKELDFEKEAKERFAEEYNLADQERFQYREENKKLKAELDILRRYVVYKLRQEVEGA